ncbi:hypothetical protein [Moraxella lacunata]
MFYYVNVQIQNHDMQYSIQTQYKNSINIWLYFKYAYLPLMGR